MEATANMKNGLSCNLLELLSQVKEFGLTLEEMKELLQADKYIGRCPQQVDAFLEVVKPAIAGVHNESAEINL